MHTALFIVGALHWTVVFCSFCSSLHKENGDPLLVLLPLAQVLAFLIPPPSKETSPSFHQLHLLKTLLKEMGKRFKLSKTLVVLLCRGTLGSKLQVTLTQGSYDKGKDALPGPCKSLKTLSLPFSEQQD
jgi:hypothetical protein